MATGDEEANDRRAPEERVAALETAVTERDAKIAEQGAQIAKLTEQVAALTKLLRRNSTNSRVYHAAACRHQQLDLRNHRPHLTEWRRRVVECERCGTCTRAAFDRNKVPLSVAAQRECGTRAPS